jgi:hypothetical protein
MSATRKPVIVLMVAASLFALVRVGSPVGDLAWPTFAPPASRQAPSEMFLGNGTAKFAGTTARAIDARI